MVSGTTIVKPIAINISSPANTIVIASGLGIRFSRRTAIGCTPNAMNAAITKIEIVRGMCTAIHQMTIAATMTPAIQPIRRHTTGLIGPCSSNAAP